MRLPGFGLLAALVLVVAAGVRFDALGSGLPHPRTRPDELPVVQAMGRVDRGEDVAILIYPHAYVYASWAWVETALVAAPLLGLEAPGGFQRTLHVAPDLIQLLGRSLSAVAGLLAVALAMWLARREWGDPAGLATGWLVATCFLHARDSHALKPDALLSLSVLLVLAAAARLAEGASGRRILATGIAFGLAMATKYTGVLMAVPIYLAGWLASPARGARRLVPSSALAAGLLGAAVFAATSPQLVFEGPMLELTRSIGGIVLPGLVGGEPEDSLVGGVGEVPEAFAPPPGVALEDYRDRSWYHGIAFHAKLSLWYGVGALATLLAPLAIAWGFASRRPLPLLAAVTCSVQALVMGLTPAVTARYLTQVLPVLLLLEAGFLAWLAQRFAPSRAALALGFAVVLLSAQPFLATLGHNRIARQTDTRVMAAQWLVENLAPGTHLAFAGSVLMPYGQPVPPRQVRVVAHGLDPEVLDAADVEVLVVHQHPLYFSTVDPAALDALAPRLTPLARFDPTAEGGTLEAAVFEETDAYYIPFHGFGHLTRPGPVIDVFALDLEGSREEREERASE